MSTRPRRLPASLASGMRLGESSREPLLLGGIAGALEQPWEERDLSLELLEPRARAERRLEHGRMGSREDFLREVH